MLKLNNTAPTRPPNIIYWLQGESRQNFGDFLTALFVKKAFLTPCVRAASYRFIGSAIDSNLINDDLTAAQAGPKDKIAYWGCGMRESAPIVPQMQARCIFRGIRGPLSRKLLELPWWTVMGDPGFLTPLIYSPQRSHRTFRKSICVPHFHDAKSDEELLALAGADYVLRPWTENSLDDLFRILDDIASADFVLAGSLHAAIIACAYGVPFCFWDNGHVDLPFKWQDLAASLHIPMHFVTNIKDGRAFYDSVTKGQLKRPAFSPLLLVAPFHLRPGILMRAVKADVVNWLHAWTNVKIFNAFPKTSIQDDGPNPKD